MSRTAAWQDHSTMHRFGIVATLTAAISVVSFVPTMLSLLGPLIIDDLDLSRSGFGTVTTFVFIGGGITSIAAGRFVDRIGGRRTLVALFGMSALTFVAMALPPSFGWLLVAAAIAGIPGALSNPVTNQVISTVVPRGERGLAIGFKQSGAQLTQVVCGLVLPTLALALGWRGATVAMAWIPLVGVVAASALLPTATTRSATRTAGRVPLRGPVGNLTTYAFFLSLGVSAVVTWLPLFAYEALGFSVAASGIVASAAAVIGFVGRIGWASAAERWIRPSLGLAVIAIGSTAAAATLAAATLVPWLVWPGVVLYGATAGAWSSVATVALLTEVDADVAGHASGVMLQGFYVGFIVSPVLFGGLADATDGYVTGWLVVAALFALGGGLAVRWHRQGGTVRAPATAPDGRPAARSRPSPSERDPR